MLKMLIFRRLTARDLALTVCFTALYVVLSFLPIFHIIGFFGKSITAATVISPIIGIVLGTYLGVTSTFLGGMIGMFCNPSFSQPSLAAGVITAMCAGMLYKRKQSSCTFIYLLLLILFGLYPSIGPIWLYPQLMWFQVVGFLIIASPLQTIASRNFNSNNNSRLIFAFFITALTSTLAGQIAGSFTFGLIIGQTTDMTQIWRIITFLYPVERTIVAIVASFIGASLFKILKPTQLLPFLNDDGCDS
jgi:biotin transporter BioY